MNRELKFRAWLPSIKKMTHSLTLWGWSKTLQSGDLVNYDVQPDVVFMQFTGLHDKNGKEIYEGDIDKYGNVVKYGEFICDSDFNYWTYGWYLEITDKDDDGEVHIYKSGLLGGRDMDNPICEIEIIGNTYENPELL